MSQDKDKQDEAVNVVGLARLFAGYINDAIDALDMATKEDADLFDRMVEDAANSRFSDAALHKIFTVAARRHRPGGHSFGDSDKLTTQLNTLIDEYAYVSEEDIAANNADFYNDQEKGS